MRVQEYGPWAVVTGASSGIGEGFARALAARGLHVVLVARRGALLAKLAEELRGRHGVECIVEELDLSRTDAADMLLAEIADLDVGLVIHNAGTGWIGRFELQSPESLLGLIRLHCEFPVELTSKMMPRLRARTRAGLVLVSSLGGYIPLPYYAVYGATKAFLASWGEALVEELRGTGVDVLVVAPGDTRTGFQDVAGERSTRWTSVELVVDRSLDALGHSVRVVPGLENRLSLLLTRFVPRALLAKIVAARQRGQTPPERR